MEKICPRCAKAVDAGDSICDACGMELLIQHDPRCPGCGQIVRPGRDMCSNCGLELEITPDVPAAGGTTYKISLSTLLVPLVAVLVVGGILRGRKEQAPKAPYQPPVAAVTAGAGEGPYEDDPAAGSSSHVKSAAVKIPDAFLLKGSVFDIQTLKPVMQPTLVFHNPNSNEYFGAYADAQGRYQAWLKAVTGGYIVTLQHANYQETYTADWAPSIRTLSEVQRRFVIGDLLANPPKPLHLYGLPDAKIEKDFGMIPIPKKIP